LQAVDKCSVGNNVDRVVFQRIVSLQAVEKCSVDVKDISSVEVVGSATRTPALQKVVEEVFQKVRA